MEYTHDEGPLNKEQFNRGQGAGFYQRPLPGMEHLLPELPKTKYGDESTGELRIDSLYNQRHDWEKGLNKVVSDSHSAAWSAMVTGFHPRQESVDVNALRPTQPHLNEKYLYEDKGPTSLPKVQKIGKGYYVNDGHHRVAREMLQGKQFVDVDVYDPKEIYG